MPFVMNFIGRIISLECGIAARSIFIDELGRMMSMYGVEANAHV